MKKVGLIFVSFVFAVFLLSFASADAAQNVQNAINQISNIVISILGALKPLATLLFGAENLDLDVAAKTTMFTVANIMIFIIVFVIVYLTLDNVEFFSDHGWAVNLLSIAVSILSVRFLTSEIINAIIFPYQALGIALSAGFPFVLYFMFVEFKMKNSFAKKAA